MSSDDEDEIHLEVIGHQCPIVELDNVEVALKMEQSLQRDMDRFDVRHFLDDKEFKLQDEAKKAKRKAIMGFNADTRPEMIDDVYARYAQLYDAVDTDEERHKLERMRYDALHETEREAERHRAAGNLI